MWESEKVYIRELQKKKMRKSKAYFLAATNYGINLYDNIFIKAYIEIYMYVYIKHVTFSYIYA